MMRHQALVATESIYLPLFSVLTSASASAVLLRLSGLMTDLRWGIAPYALLLCISVVSSGITLASCTYNLPRYLRLVDLALITGVGLVFFSSGPYQMGRIYMFGLHRSVAPLYLGFPTVLVAWGVAMLLTWAAPMLRSPTSPLIQDEVLAARLAEENMLLEVYHRKRVAAVRTDSWNYTYAVTGIVFAVYLIVICIWNPSGHLRNDPILAALAGLTIVGLLTYLALVHLTARWRITQHRRRDLVINSGQRAWVVGALIPVLLAGCLGYLLPANISPLRSLDYQKIGDTISCLLFTCQINDSFTPSGMTEHRSRFTFIQGTGGGYIAFGRGNGPVGIFILLVIFAGMPWVLIKSYQALHPIFKFMTEKERSRGKSLARVIIALLTWPIRYLRTWLRNRKARRAQVEITAALSVLQQHADPALIGDPEDAESANIRRMYKQLLDQATAAGIKRNSSATANEYAQVLTEAVPEQNPAISVITQAYTQVRYSPVRRPAAGVGERLADYCKALLHELHRLKGDRQ